MEPILTLDIQESPSSMEGLWHLINSSPFVEDKGNIFPKMELKLPIWDWMGSWMWTTTPDQQLQMACDHLEITNRLTNLLLQDIKHEYSNLCLIEWWNFKKLELKLNIFDGREIWWSWMRRVTDDRVVWGSIHFHILFDFYNFWLYWNEP